MGRRQKHRKIKNRRLLSEPLESRELLAADGFSDFASVKDDAGSAHPAGCACPACGDCAGEYSTDTMAMGADLGGGHFVGDGHDHHGHGEVDYVVIPEGERDYYRFGGGVPTIILDFNDSGQANTTDRLGNTVSTWDAAGEFDNPRSTIANGVLNQVRSYYQLVDRADWSPSPMLPEYELDIEFEIGNIGSPPANGSTNYYYLQIGDGVAGNPNNGFGVAGIGVAAQSNGSPGVWSPGSVVGSVFTDNISQIDCTFFSCSWDLDEAINAISFTTAHEIGHALSLEHIDFAGATTPTGRPAIMSTGPTGLPSSLRYDVTHEFSLNGNNSQAGGRQQFHMQQLINAVGVVDTDTNDQISEAISVGFGNHNGTISYSTDVDMFRFNVGSAGQVIGFDIDNMGGTLDSIVRVFDGSGNVVGFDDDGTGPAPEGSSLESYAEVRFGSPGTYFVGVSDFPNSSYDALTGTGDSGNTTGEGTYTLRIQDRGVDTNGTLSTANAITIGNPINGALSQAVDLDILSFSAGANQTINFDLNLQTGNINPRMRVFNGSGTQLAFVNGTSLTHTFSTAGTYYLGVSNRVDYNPNVGNAFDNDFNSTGTFELTTTDADNLVVDNLVDESDGDFSPEDLSLREAMELANSSPGETIIRFANGLNGRSIDLTNQLPTITQSVSIVGPGADLLTLDGQGGGDNMLDGDGFRLFNIHDGAGSRIDVEISGITLTGGDLGPSSALGQTGGAIVNSENLTLRSVYIHGNRGKFGGAIANSGTLNLVDSTMANNQSLDNGGGGAINSSSVVNIVNSTLSGNSSDAAGGAIINYAPTSRPANLTIENSTLSNNTAAGSGEAIISFGPGSKSVTLDNSILDGSVAGSPFAGDHNLFRGADPGIAGTNNQFNTDPMLGPLAENAGPTLTHALLPGSPAIDTGAPSTATNDQRGTPFVRDDGNGVDIGAYERQSLDADSFVVNTTNDELDFTNSDVSLREAIVSANGSAGNETISFDESLSGQSILLDEQLPTIVGNVTIEGPGANLMTIDAQGGGDNQLDGDGFRIFDIDDGQPGTIDVEISGLTLTGGDHPSVGGAILNGENLTLSSMAIERNRSGFGGGLLGRATSQTTIVDSTISENETSRNGAGFENAGQMVIVNSTISGNVADASGGAFTIFGQPGVNATIEIRNSTIANNASSSTNPVWVANGYSTATLTLENTIVADAVSNSGTINGDFNLFTNADPGIVGANNLFSTDPQLGPLAENGGPTRTHALPSSSPAVNAGTASSESFDQRGQPFLRNDGNGVDIGAFEQQSLDASLFRVTTANDEFDFTNSEVSLREAITAANFNSGFETISFDSALAGQSILLNSQLPTITGDVTIFGLGADLLTIDAQGGGDNQLDGDGFRIFDVDDGQPGTIDVEISGLTLTGGDHPSVGGAILNGENLTLSSMAIERNRSGFGGGLLGRPTSQTTIVDSTISENETRRNGAGFENAGQMVIVNSTISGNVADASGGAFTMFGNPGVDATLEIRNSTIANNASSSTNPVWIANGYSTATLTLENTIVADAVSNSGTINGDYNLLRGTDPGIAGTNNLFNTIPDLGPLTNNGGPTRTHGLQPNSPAINAGNPTAIAGVGQTPEFDQRGDGFSRVVGDRLDMGAFEFVSEDVDPDFNDDGSVDGLDIDLLQANIVTGPADPAMFDLNGDGIVDVADRDEWLVQAGALNLPSGNPYLPGDANLDGVVDVSDFGAWNANKFTATSAWTDSDFNADGVVDVSDFGVWNANKFTASDAATAPSRDSTSADVRERPQARDRIFAELVRDDGGKDDERGSDASHFDLSSLLYG